MAEGDARLPVTAPEATSGDPALAPQRLCAGDELVDKGRAVVFDVVHFREPARAFALRFDGNVVAYLNRCLHVPTELDWQPGEFLDADRAFIICAIHGATYAPQTGHCVGGPCGSGRLTRLATVERDGVVWWQPTRDTRPAPPTAATPPV